MKNILFEKEHKPKGSFPYLEFTNKNHNYISHYHEEIEIAYVESGNISAYSSSYEISLHAGDICIFMPGEIHSFFSKDENNIFIFKLNTHSYIEKINFDNIRLLNNKISPDNINYKTFYEIINEIHKEYTEKKQGYEFAIRSLKNSFILNILRHLEYRTEDRSKNIHMINDINNYLEQHYTEKIILSDIAEVCHMSKYYFSHIFKQLTGMSFISYLSLFRTEKATILLRYTNKSMNDIAYECGFGNVRSFNRMFKENLNITPLQYKKLHFKK